LENGRKECEIIHKEKLSCGGKYVAGCAQIKISTKCRRKHSKEKKDKEVKLRRESGKTLQGGEPLKVFTKVSGQDSFQREVNDSRPSDLGELHGGCS
jgi:hypothetical protein